MTTSNLSTTLTAILPSATSTTLGGVLVDSTSSGLLAMSDGHIAVKYSTGLQIDSTGHLHVDSTQFLTTSDAFAEYAQISSLSNYLPVTGGIVYGPTQIDSTGSLHPGNIQFNVDGTGAFLEFNVGVSGVNGGIVFSDGSTQTTAFTVQKLLNITDWVSNSQTGVWTGSPSSITLGPDNNCEIIQLSSYPTTLNVIFPTPANDGQFFELVIIGGSGGYAFSGLGIDGVTSVTILNDIGSTAYEKGGFRYKTSTNTWYQVS
jgi:hypothetical protein